MIIDDRHESFPTHDSKLFRQLCHRNLGIGADGVILLQNTSNADFRMRIFNADGSEAEMCGNGLRCFYQFLRSIGYSDKKCKVETLDGLLEVSPKGDKVCIEMGPPSEVKLHLNIESLESHFLYCGVPHLIHFVDNLAKVPVATLGKKLRYSKSLGKNGANVDFVEILSNSSIAIRTYERGVEAETLACGTGATASALAAALVQNLPSPIQVYLHSGDLLEIDYQLTESIFTDVTMTGPATHVFDGKINLSIPSLSFHH